MIEPRGANLSVQLVRVFDASIELVYAAWSEAQHVTQWMKCDELATLEVENWVPEVGTEFKTHMAQPGVFESTSTGRFTEVDPPVLLAYMYDAQPSLGVPDMHVRVELRELGEQTEVTLTQTGIPNDRIFGFIEGGWTSSMRQLATVLANKLERG